MEFNQIKGKVIETWHTYFEKYGISNNESYPMLKLGEEVGELSEAYLNYKGFSRPEKSILKSKDELRYALSQELADVVGTAMLMAEELEIDLEKAIKEKWFDRNN